MRKLVIGLVVLSFAGLLGWRIYSATRGEEESSRGGKGGAAVAVEVAAVRVEEIRDVSQFTGTLYPKSYIAVAPKVGGRLEKLMVDIGDVVKSGEPIAEIDDAEYAQQVEQARAELKVAEANVLEAKSAMDVEAREFERVTALREKKIASESDFDTARARKEAQEARYQVAEAQVAQREAALRGAEVRLSYTRIAAVWDEAGTTRLVGERFADEGAMLRANDPIVSIIDIAKLTAVVNVIERDYSKIGVGQKAAITTDAYPGRVVEGTIVRVAPLLKESSRQARVEAEVDNADGLLKPGMFIIAHIEFDRHEAATVVPVQALARREGVEGVFVADMVEKKVRFVPVTVGIRSETAAEIVDPPVSGQVVTLGQHLLSDGAAITVAEAGKAGRGEAPKARSGEQGGAGGGR